MTDEEESYSVVPVTGVRVEIGQVPKNKRHHPKYLSELADLHQRLSQDTYLDLFAIHETGHVIYFQKAGITDFNYIRPKIIYLPNTAERAEDFIGQWAAIMPNNFVEPPDPHKDPESFTKWLFDHAMGYAAGGAVSRKLTTTSYGGDKNDRRQFGELCNAAYKDDASKFMNIQSMWVDAQTRVEQDLNDEFEREIRTKMLDVKQRLYFSSP